MNIVICAVILGCLSAANCFTSFFPEEKSLLANRELSTECEFQYNSLDTLTFLRMFDASTKFPSGFMNYSLFDFGNFDECYYLEAKGTDNNDIYGKYCLGTLSFEKIGAILGSLTPHYKTINVTAPKINRPIPMHPDIRMLGQDQNTLGYHFAICIPDKCTGPEISIIQDFQEEFCYSRNNTPEFTTGAIATTTFIGIVLALVLLSSAYDTYLHYTEQKAKHELLIAFSAVTNGKKIFKSTSNPDQLLCINGIRAISMMWVILGHVYSIGYTNGPFINIQDILTFQSKAENMWMMSATVSVDTFFIAGGLVTVYTFLKSMDKGAKFNIFLYYVHRFLRLSPAFGVCCLVYANLLTHFGNGPMWSAIDSTLSQPCHDRWYASFFYFSNYYHAGCVPQSWYLSVDMQLFLLSPIVLIPLVKWRKVGLAILAGLCCLGMIIPFVIGYIYKLNAFMQGDTQDMMMYYYIQTHCRFGPYVIGMLYGYYIYDFKKNNRRIRLEPVIVCGLWLIAIGGLVGCIWAPYDASQAEYDRVSHSFFFALHRPIWSALVGMVIYLCVIGYGGPINSFLSHPVFQFLTKLSYSMYLVHYAVVSLRYYSIRTNLYFSSFVMLTTFWGDFMLTAAISLVLCLSFESPIIILEKYLFGRGKPKKVEKKVESA